MTLNSLINLNLYTLAEYNLDSLFCQINEIHAFYLN